MSKRVISILFSIIFLSTILVPAVLVIVDDIIDTSISFSISENGEMECEKDLDIEFLLFYNQVIDSDFVFKTSECGLVYFYKKYTKPHLNIISPPPDYYIL